MAKAIVDSCSQSTADPLPFPSQTVQDVLTAVLRDGAQRMLSQAAFPISAELLTIREAWLTVAATVPKTPTRPRCDVCGRSSCDGGPGILKCHGVDRRGGTGEVQRSPGGVFGRCR